MIEAGIFDLGGVVVHSGYRSIQREIKRSFRVGDKGMWEILRDVEGDIETGAVMEQDYWRRQSEKFGIFPPVEQIVFENAYREEFSTIDGTVDLLKELKNRGLRLTALSNTIPSHAAVIRDAGILDLFDSVVLSYETGFRKPALEIYKLAIEKNEKPAKQTIYVDDLPKNVKAAEGVGLMGIVFKCPVHLRDRLNELGLII